MLEFTASSVFQIQQQPLALLSNLQAYNINMHNSFETSRSFFVEIGEFRLWHTLRAGNFCADGVAQIGVNQRDTLCLVDHPPLAICGYLMPDAMQVHFACNAG